MVGQVLHNRPLKIFLCHGSEDKPIVRQIYDRLRDDGLDPWLDEKNLLPGQNWDLEIKKAARTCDSILVCLSARAVNKEGYVQREIKIALDTSEEKPDGTIFIIPLKLEACEVPERLKNLQYIEYEKENWYEMTICALRERARKLNLAILPGDGMLRRLNNQLQIVAGKVLYKGADVRELLRLAKDGILLDRDVKIQSHEKIVAITFEALEEALEPFLNILRQDEEKRRILRLVGIVEPYKEWKEARNKFYCFSNEQAQRERETAIERIPVRSSNIVSIGYSTQEQTLEVAFKDDSVYQYFNVPENLYLGLMNADSHGQYLDTYIKKGAFRYRRIK